MRILIAGASGAIGRPLNRRLRANQHQVFALTRASDSAPALKEIGAEPVIAHALDAAAVKAAVGRIRPDAVINQLTSLPRHYTPADEGSGGTRPQGPSGRQQQKDNKLLPPPNWRTSCHRTPRSRRTSSQSFTSLPFRGRLRCQHPLCRFNVD
jgi:hypothetical protein